MLRLLNFCICKWIKSNLFIVQEEKALRSNKHYHTIDTNKNGVRFRNSRLRDLNEEYVEAKQQYTQQQQGVVSEIINIACKI